MTEYICILKLATGCDIGAADLGFRQIFFAVHLALNDAARYLLLCQGGVLCHCVVIDKLVVSRFLKISTHGNNSCRLIGA